MIKKIKWALNVFSALVPVFHYIHFLRRNDKTNNQTHNKKVLGIKVYESFYIHILNLNELLLLTLCIVDVIIKQKYWYSIKLLTYLL